MTVQICQLSSVDSKLYTKITAFFESYHFLVDLNASILLVESQVILNRITSFKSKNILKCAFKAKNAQGAVRMMRLARVCN